MSRTDRSQWETQVLDWIFVVDEERTIDADIDGSAVIHSADFGYGVHDVKAVGYLPGTDQEKLETAERSVFLLPPLWLVPLAALVILAGLARLVARRRPKQ